MRSSALAAGWPRRSDALHIGAAMQITLVPDSSIASAPAGLTAAVEAAADIFEQDFPGSYNVNISYGWGTFVNAPSAFLTDPGSGVFSLGGGTSFGVNYSQLRGWLTTEAASSAQITAVASLPASSASFPGDANTFFVSRAEEKALGVFSGDSGAIDGSIGFNIGDASSPQDWEPAALTEIAHALGWDSIAQGGSFPDVADLFRYSSPGQYQWTSGQPAYFSVDGGNTDLADFSTTFDQTLFTDLPADDPLRLPFTSAASTLTSFDIEALSVIGFGVSAASPPPPPGFNAGGSSSDILWQNTDGQAAIWEMDGTSVITSEKIGPNPGPSWKVIGTGDFNGDENSDLLWQNANGQAAIWEIDGTDVIASAKVDPNPGPSWKLVGTGDFNGDGNSDLLWQNASGQAAIWEMDGTNVIDSAKVDPNPGPSWKLVGTGDFNGDGKSDLLWQNTSGQAAIWEMNGTNVIDSAKIGPNPGLSWKVVGTGDFNGDGQSDLLWQNTSGQVAIWEMDGTNVIASAKVDPNPGPSWKLVGTGDFNGDGFSDLLWQNTSGQAAIWEMDGTNVIDSAKVVPNPGPSWRAL
jgi:FG-GAP-like repeat